MTSVTDNFENLNEMTSKGYENVRKLGELNLQIMETLVSRQMDAANMWMETAMRQFRLVSEAKGYNDLLKGEMELAREMGERLLSESRENMKLMNETRENYRGWYEQSVADVAKKAASQA